MKKLFRYVVHFVNGQARVAADRVNGKYNAMNATMQKIVLVCFCVVFACASVWVAVCSFNHGKVAKPLRVEAMPKPVVVQEKKLVIPISRAEYERIERCKAQIIANDSLLRARPRLLDSIKLFESIYQSQK